MSNLRKNTAVTTTQGSEFAIAKEVQETGEDLSPTPASYITLPFIENSSNADNITESPFVLESGASRILSSEENYTWNVTFAQQDAATKMLPVTWGAKYFQVIKEMHTTAVDGKYQYLVMPIVKIQKNRTLEAKGGLVSYTFELLSPQETLTVELDEITMGTGATGFQIETFAAGSDVVLAPGQYYGIWEGVGAS